MKFCQADGTLLVEDAPAAGEDDPFRTVLATPPGEEEFDPMKTMLATPPPVDAQPPSPFAGGSDPLKKEPRETEKTSSPFDREQDAPRFNDSPLPSSSAPQEENRYSGGFGEPQPQPQERASGGFGDQRPFQEPESPFGNQPNFSNDPFANQQNDWSAPPAPQGWGNQNLGQNTPFSTPPTSSGTSGLPMIMGIISLILGLISFPAMCLCYLNFITAPLCIILGAVAFFTAKNDPAAKNGKLMGIAGAALSLLSIVTVILIIVIYGLSAISR